MSEKSIELAWLSDVTVKTVSKISPPRRETVVRTPPDTVDIRVFADGKCYPSENFAKSMNLEYQAREPLDDTGKNFNIKGNGIDIWDSKGWSQVELPEGVRVLFATVSAKALAKVSLWDSTKYNEDNTPKASVFTQGAQTYGKNTLIPMLEEVYGIDWETTKMVDLKFAEDSLPQSEDGVYHIPKVISTGKNKGQSTFVRRTDCVVFPLVVAEVHPKEVKKVDAVKEATTETAPVMDQDAEDFAKQLGGDSINDIKVDAEEVKVTK